MTNPGDTGGIADALARIAERSANLSRLDDEYLKLIGRSEEALRGLNIGVPISVDIAPDGPTPYGESQLLTFDKVAGSWRLSHEYGPDDGDPDSWSSVPLASCDRDLRFEVFAEGHLARLIHKAQEVLDHAIAKREAHLGPSKALVAAIEQARPARPAKGGKP